MSKSATQLLYGPILVIHSKVSNSTWSLMCPHGWVGGRDELVVVGPKPHPSIPSGPNNSSIISCSKVRPEASSSMAAATVKPPMEYKKCPCGTVTGSDSRVRARYSLSSLLSCSGAQLVLTGKLHPTIQIPSLFCVLPC